MEPNDDGPCPKCGGRFQVGDEAGGEFWMTCMGCGHEGPHAATLEKAFSEWNNLPMSDDLPAFIPPRH